MALIAVGLALGAPAALGSPAHVFAFSFAGGEPRSQPSHPRGIAVDNSTGPSAHDIYVTDPGNARVEKFGAAGNFILMFGKDVDQTTGGDVCTAASHDLCQTATPSERGFEPEPGGPPGSFREPGFIAVDSSAGPSAGDVYVADWATNLVSKFDDEGSLIASWGTEGQLSFNGINGIAVDRSGNLFVLSADVSSTISEYGQAGSLISSTPTPGETDGAGIAVDSSGDLYKMTSAVHVEKFNTGGEVLGGFEVGGYGLGFGLDARTGDLYLDINTGFINDFAPGCEAPSCAPLTSFGSGYLNPANYIQGVSVDSSNNTVCVSEPGGLSDPEGGEVAVFDAPGTLADATTGESSGVLQSSASVSGEIDPSGGDPVSGCDFEYVDDAAYRADHYTEAKSAPCKQAPPYAAPTSVGADLSGLNGGTTYHFRLVAENARGVSRGIDHTFTTIILPVVTTGPAAAVAATSAALSGEVDPAGGTPVSACRFEYVDEADFRAHGYAGAKSASCVLPPPYLIAFQLDANISGLREATTYRYRLVASNAVGASAGGDGSFTTLFEPPETTKPPPPIHPLAVRCSRKACTQVLEGGRQLKTWSSPRFPASYGWLFSVYRDGRSLPGKEAGDGCSGNFAGAGMVAALDGCQGRLKLSYRGSGPFKIRWRVFAQCRACSEHADHLHRH